MGLTLSFTLKRTKAEKQIQNLSFNNYSTILKQTNGMLLASWQENFLKIKSYCFSPYLHNVKGTENLNLK